MKRFKALASAAIVTAVAAGSVLIGIAAPAQAGTGNCPAGYTCIWRDANYVSAGNGAGLVKFQYYIPDYRSHSYEAVGGNANDNASSSYNNGRLLASRIFEHATQGGKYFTMERGAGSANLTGVSMNINDMVSSGYFSDCWGRSCY